MTEESRLVIDGEIEKLLEEFNPSELDSQVTRMCPFYEDGDREMTSVYGSIHRFTQSRLLSRLQLKLDDMSVGGEMEGEGGGRIDGVVSEYEVAINGKKIEIQADDGGEVHELAVLEVKTGGLGPLQPAAYACQWGLPVIVAEVKTGDVHLVDKETAREFLSEAATHMKDMERLREEDQKIPDYYQCKNCGNKDCEHNRDGRIQTGNGAIRAIKKKSEILSNLDLVVDGIVSTLQEIIKDNNYQPIEDDTGKIGR